MFAILEITSINDADHWIVRSLSEEREPGAIACPKNIVVGDVYHGGGFYNRVAFERGKPPRTLADAQSEKISALEDLADALRVRVSGSSHPTKIDVYKIKYEIACAALAGDQAALAVLAPEAASRGETPTQLATLVKYLGDQWRMAGLGIDAIYQGHKRAIQALEEIEAVDAYDHAIGWKTFG